MVISVVSGLSVPAVLIDNSTLLLDCDFDAAILYAATRCLLPDASTTTIMAWIAQVDSQPSFA